VFAAGQSVVAGPLVAVTVLGFGVGAVSAAMPAMILAVTPGDETASAMSVDQVVRSVGFSAAYRHKGARQRVTGGGRSRAGSATVFGLPSVSADGMPG
jgi:hypothetical protein